MVAPMFGASGVEIILILLIFMVSAATQGLLGFGFGIMAMTLLPLLLGLRDAVTLLALLTCGTMLLSIYWQRQSFYWRDARLLVSGALAGIPLGVYMVQVLAERVLMGILGGAMVYAAAIHFFRQHQARRPPQPVWEFPLGVASGILAAGFNMGGPPVVTYCYSRNWPLDQAKAILSSVFITTATARLFFIGFTGEQLDRVLGLAALSLPVIAVMLRLSIGWGRRLPSRHLQTVVFLYLGGMGLYYLLRP